MRIKRGQEILMLGLFILIFIAIRSIHYIYHLNFSGDQASFSIKALEILRNKKLVLIGPPISINLGGRQLFQGPATYYMFLIFLVFGKLDPACASYLFMLFCALMIIPLYYGVKLLLGFPYALVMLVVYTFTPYYINYTRFLWNPTFQFSLIPLLILLMGVFSRKKSSAIFLTISFFLGILLQFHYQFILIILSLFIYYFLVVKVKPTWIILFFLGIVLGFSPIIIFELRNQFYNLNTAILFLKNYNRLDRPGGQNTPHYYISLSFLFILGTLALWQKFITFIANDKKRFLKMPFYFHRKRLFFIFLISLTLVLFVQSAQKNFRRPQTSFWAFTENWNYPAEVKVYNIIKSTGLKNYNIANLAYDTLSLVQKYLLKKDKVDINYDDYWHNQYLFVINKDDQYMNNPAYEVNTFKPSKLIKQWPINERFTLYLLKRL